jgi:hypothetical protein
MPSLAALAVGAAALAVPAAAYQSYVALNPNGASVGVAAIGHVDPNGGGPRNAYGAAFAGAGHAWTVALCQADSDGDGQYNGLELGDPCCAWVTGGAPPAFSTDISHPGLASSTTNRTAPANCSAASPSMAPSQGASPPAGNNTTVEIGVGAGVGGAVVLLGAAMLVRRQRAAAAARAGEDEDKFGLLAEGEERL